MAATWKQSITTSAGIALMNKAYGVSSIIPTKAVTITDDISGLSVTQVMALTSVKYNQSRVPIVISNQANTTRIGIDIDNKDVNEQYDYFGIGVYFKQVNTGEEVLFSVIPLSGEATIIPNQNGVATSSISIDSYTSIVPGTNVDLTVSDSGSVTRADVEQIVAANQSFSFPKKPLATGIDLQSIKSIGIYQINDDKTVVNAPDGFSGNGYLIVVGDGTTANPIVQEITDTVTGNNSINVYNSSLNKWDGWQQFSYKSYVDDSIKSANEHADNGLATKADDSKVVHNIPTLMPSGTDLNTVTSTGYYQIVGAINRPKNADDWTIYQVATLRSSLSNGVQTAFDTNGNAQSNRVWNGRGWSSWVSFADDSKVVHTADMRKPANDVAGIEEVNAKQDKIGYTPADDSKVVHDNGNGTIQVDGTQVNPYNKLSDTIGGRNLLIGSTDNMVHYDSVPGYTAWKSYVTQFNVGDTLNLSVDITSNAGNTVLKVFLLSSTGNQVGYLSYPVSEGQTAHAFISKTIPTGTASILAQIDNGTPIGKKDVCAISHQFANTGSVSTDWTPAPEDKVNVADMRKPASDVAGIEEVTAKADDSKVAHLYGANNFDTVPTVNNNPLLLASSLPSDLARTSQQTNFTAGLQSGGVNVATADDLNNYYHANASDAAALSAAKSATVPGIFWFEEV